MEKLTKKEQIMRFVESQGNKARYMEIIEFAFKLNYPNKRFYQYSNRGYYSCAFSPRWGGHLVKGGKAELRKNDDGSYSVWRKQVDGSYVKPIGNKAPEKTSEGRRLAEEAGNWMNVSPAVLNVLAEQSKGRTLRTGIPAGKITMISGSSTLGPELASFNFVHSSVYKEKYAVDFEKLRRFAAAFNLAIHDNKLSLNTGLDTIEHLNEQEFSLAVMKADASGWQLTRHEDNYNSITYKMKLKE